MPYVPGLKVHEPSHREMQSARYDHLAAFSHKVLTVHGRPQYTQAALRGQLVRARVLDKNGIVRQERMEKFLGSRGFKGHLPGEGSDYDPNEDYEDQDWFDVLEGGSE